MSKLNKKVRNYINFIPQDILLKRDIDYINKVKLEKEYKEKFEKSRLEYNAKQTRDDRKIDDLEL